MKILVEYILIGETFPLDFVKKQIGISDCETANFGDIVFYGSYKQYMREETHTSITYSTGYIQTTEVEFALEKIYKMLFEKKEIIRENIDKYELNSKFCVTISLTDNPIIAIPQKFINLASYLKAFIEFDTYLDINTGDGSLC